MSGWGLRAPARAEVTPDVDQTEQADLVEERIELPAPVRTDADGKPGLTQGRQGRRRLGIRHHVALIRRPQRIDQAVDVGVRHAAGAR